jgi:eukaryotic-like serine/threonine-protein kinase
MRDLLPPGTLLRGGEYRVDYALGQGGFGITYRALDLSLERPVAIKEFYPRKYAHRDASTGQLLVPESDTPAYQRWLGRFEREGRILARLAHPGIVKVFSLFKERNTAYLVMELLPGGSLREELKTQPGHGLPEQRVMEVMNALVAALDAVHGEGVYHLDLKPDNVMVTSNGQVVLIDFGAARQESTALTSHRGQRSSTLAFTPNYAPLELISGEPIGAESDLFELGMMLHELLTGTCPPAVLSRLSQNVWEPENLGTPWRDLLSQALHLRREHRPSQVKQWWLSPSISQPQEVVEAPQQNMEQTQAAERIEQAAEAEQRRQEAERQLRREAEQRAAEQRAAEAERKRRQAQELARKEAAERQREQQAQSEEGARTRAEAAKLKHSEAERKAVPTPVVPSSELKSAIQLNRRGLLLAGLGAAGLGGVWLVNQATQQQTVSDSSSSPTPAIDESSLVPVPEIPVVAPLSPAPFTSPSSFSFSVMMVNETGEVVSHEYKSGRYFTEDLGGGVMLEMVEIPAGDFIMGSPPGELERESNESPQHRVNIAGFSMGRFVVTQAQWQAVMGSNPSGFKGEKNPVENVSWNDAQAFCKKLSQQTGRTYRLPSEAEWEYACRAGTTTPFHFGPTIRSKLANYNGEYSYGAGPKGQSRRQTTPVDSFVANGFGLHDMHGNVWEWCLDHWHDNYNGAPTDGRAWVENSNSSLKVSRGGSWYNNPRNCRSADRVGYHLESNYYNLGFRLVLFPP